MSVSNIAELGEIGEEIALIFFAGGGFDVQLSESAFDSRKDMLVNGKTIEIKTQTRLKTGSCFSTQRKPTNLKKCMIVDRLIFVEFDASEYISIFEPIDRKHYTDYSFTGDNNARVTMRGWYIYENEVGPGCKLITRLRLPQITARMRALSPSKYYINDKERSRYSQRAQV